MKKAKLIKKINKIIGKFGSFTVADVEAESSPILKSKGKLTHLGEEFMDGTCIVFTYDPTSYTSDEIDQFDEFYEEFEKSQLVLILGLAKRWREIKQDEIINNI
jgi:hypothetical protein